MSDLTVTGEQNMKRIKTVAFSSGNPRFGKFTGHPNLTKCSPCNKLDACDPCRYSPNHDYKKCHTHVPGREPWTYQKNLEEWARHLGYRNYKIIKRKKTQASNLGPAWHDVKFYPKYEPACTNIQFGRTSRFPKRHTDNIPGPGTYYKENPYKAPYGPHSTRPTFEREHPCRFKDTVPPWFRGVSCYNVIDKDAIAMKSKKIVSLRGPYDLFTGKRDASTIISKHNYGKKTTCITWPYNLRLDTMNKSYAGGTIQGSRDKNFERNAATDVLMCRRHPNDPGPGHYNPYAKKAVAQNKAPFNINDNRPLNFNRSKVGLPAVGQYNIAVKGSCSTPGHGHLFRSTTKRDLMQFFVKKSMRTF